MFATVDPFLFWVDVVIGNYTDLGFLGALFMRDVCFVVGDFVRMLPADLMCTESLSAHRPRWEMYLKFYIF